MQKTNKIKAKILTLVIIATAAACVGCSDSTVGDSSNNNAVTDSFVSSSSKADSSTKLTESKDEEFSSNIRDDGNMDIIAYDGGANIINIPDSVDGKPVVEIKGYFLSGRDNVVEINVPDTIMGISEEAFSLCTNLEKLTLGNNVKTIGESLCLSDASLKEITLSESLTEIPFCTFAFCTSLETITIPHGVTTLCENAFSGCSSLKEVHIPDSVTEIAENSNSSYSAFDDCDNLTIYAPAGSYAEQYAKDNNIPFVAE